MAASELDWDPQAVVRKIRRYARRLDRTFGDLVELMEEIPTPDWKELGQLAERKRPMTIQEHLLAVIEEGVGRLGRLIGDLRYGARRESFRLRELGREVESGAWDRAVERLEDARERLEALALESRSEAALGEGLEVSRPRSKCR